MGIVTQASIKVILLGILHDTLIDEVRLSTVEHRFHLVLLFFQGFEDYFSFFGGEVLFERWLLYNIMHF